MKAFFEKYGIWIAIGFIILWLVKIQRTMSLQNVLIVSLAKKAGLELPNGKKKKEQDDDEFIEHEDVTDKEEEEQEEEEEEEKRELTEDEINQLVEDMQTISTKIKSKEKISKEDEEYYRMFFNDMHHDLKLEPLPAVGATIIPLHQNQATQKAESKPETTQDTQGDEKKTYEVNGQTSTKSESNKMLTGDKEDQQTNGVPVKKYTAQEKKDLIMRFFLDTPLYQKEIAEKLAQATGTKVNPGNTNGFVAELLEEKKLQEHPSKIDGKAYYGPPTWFEKKKLTKEYIKKIK